MGSAPSVPVYNPADVAQVQGQFNEQTGIESQLMSQTGQNTPYGTLGYQQTGSYYDPLTGQTVPLETSTTTLSPTEQELLGLGQGTQVEAAAGGNQLLGAANYGATNPVTDIGGYTSGLTNQMLGLETSALNPYFQQQTEALTSQLANQGLTPTDPAYKTAMNNLMQSQNQSVTGFLAQAEPQAFGQATQLYQEPAALASSLFALGAPANLTQNLINTPTGNVAPTNVTGAFATAQQAQDLQAQLAEQQYSGMLSGIGNLGGALLA